MAIAKNKIKNDTVFTYDEYKKTFFPRLATEEMMRNEDPQDFAMALAKQSLQKLKDAIK